MRKKGSMVYVIDRDGSLRTAFAILLRSADFNVETFSSDDEFLNNSRQKENGCILVDMRTAGSTGFNLPQKLVARGIRLPVIVISTFGDEPTRQLARKSGAVAFFRKPVDDQALLDAIWFAILGS
jgi:FixJ family two-component response regulator